MKNGVFLVVDRNFMSLESGIGNKIRKQVELFNKNDLSCKILLQNVGRNIEPSILGKIMYYMPFSNRAPRWEIMAEFLDCDFVYFRHPAAITYAMKKTIKKAKRLNPKLKFYMELPTFPYDGEYIGIKNKIVLVKDKINRKNLEGIIDCVFAIDPMRKIEGYTNVKTVNFLNGYDVDNSVCRHYIPHEGIELTCVGMFNKWHGYERIIEGLYLYYKNGGSEKIKINMVGEGAENNYYRELVEKYELNDRVIFYGKKYGDELETIYSKTDIGISSLGRYKCNIDILGDLKTREYFSKGIPVLSGCKVDFFEQTGEKIKYYMEVSNDEKPVDISEVINFYNMICEDKKTVNIEQYLHDYAKQTFDMSITLRPVIDELLK